MNEISSRNQQVGGSHYMEMIVQPFELIQEIDANYWVGNVIKYVSRHRRKNREQDLSKAMHYAKYAMENNIVQDCKVDAPMHLYSYKTANGLNDIEIGAIISMYYNEYDECIEKLCLLVRSLYHTKICECHFFDKADGKCSYRMGECKGSGRMDFSPETNRGGIYG